MGIPNSVLVGRAWITIDICPGMKSGELSVGTKFTFVSSVASPWSLGTRLNQTSVSVLTGGLRLPVVAVSWL